MATVHTAYQMIASSSEGEIPAACNELILQQLPQVHYIASRIHERLPQQVELHDLVQAGVIGLIEACRNFNSSKNAQLSTYATFRIKGAIMDALRSLDWGSRSMRDKAREITKACTDMETTLGRAPTSEEIAEELGISLAKLNEVQADLHGLYVVNQQTAMPGEDGETLDLIESAASTWDNPFEAYSKAESIAPLIAAVATLSEREQVVLSLYYQDELTMREVAQIVGIAVSRVCQIHATAIKKLKAMLSSAPVSTEARTR